MILQPIPSEFPYFRGKFDFLFFIIVLLAFKHEEFSSSFYKVEGSCEKFKTCRVSYLGPDLSQFCQIFKACVKQFFRRTINL